MGRRPLHLRGHPQVRGGTGADLTYVDAATTDLIASITKDSLVVGKSTVPVGTAARLSGLVAETKNDGVSVSLAWNPEFLREGFAVEDTLRPDRLVVGTGSEADEAVLREVYAEALGRETPGSPQTSKRLSSSRSPPTRSSPPRSASSTPSQRSPRTSGATSPPWPTPSDSTRASAASSSTPESASAEAACPRTSVRCRPAWPSWAWTTR